MPDLKVIEADASAAAMLNGPRADLARAIAARETAAERAAAARAPLGRIDALLAQEAAAREKVAQLGAANAAMVEKWAREELTEWARGAGELALAPNDDLAAAKQELAQAERLGDAARAARPALKAEADDGFREFRAAGGIALEVVSGGAAPHQIQTALGLALRAGLEGSVGSDCHDPALPWHRPGRLAKLPLAVAPVWNRWGPAPRRTLEA